MVLPSHATVGLATGAATLSSVAIPNDGIFGVAGLSTKLVHGASTSITSTSCSLAVSSWFLIAVTVVFKRVPSFLSSSMNSWSSSLLSASMCFLADCIVVTGQENEIGLEMAILVFKLTLHREGKWAVLCTVLNQLLVDQLPLDGF